MTREQTMREFYLRLDGSDSRSRKIAVTDGFWQTLWIVAFAALYLLRDLAGVKFPDLVFSGLCMVGFLWLDRGSAAGILLFTSALTVPHNEIRLLYLAVVVAKMLLLGQGRFSGWLLVVTLSMLALQLVDITAFGREALGKTIYNYVIRMLPLLLPLFWYSQDLKVEECRWGLMCYVAGAMLGSLVVVILTGQDLGWEELFSGEALRRLGRTYAEDAGSMQTTYNANQLAGMMSISFTAILVSMDQKKVNPIFGVIVMVWSVLVVLMTRSRTAVLVLALVLLVYYWIMIVRRKKILQGILLLLAMVGIGAWLLNTFPGIVEAVMERFTDQEDITNGRTDLFAEYIQAWMDNTWCFFFGYGIGSYVNMVDIQGVPHNMLTDILICWGIVGMFLIAVTLVMLYRRGIRNVPKKLRLLAALPAAVALITAMGGQYLTTHFPHMRLCFLLLAAGAFAPNPKKGNSQ